MVKQPQHPKLNDEVRRQPPLLGESWWEAVLAEEEEKNIRPGTRKPHQSNGTPSAKTAHPAAESTGVDWSKAVEIYDTDQTISLLVTGFNRGGLLVNGDGLQGFVPVSHLVETPPQSEDIDSSLFGYVEHSLLLKIIECDPERGRIVFSERAALAEPGTRNSLLERLQPGDQITGVITNVTDFGVFVDLGGVEGLVHVSEISWGRVHHPADVVSVGEEAQVYVINVDRERARIALSLKRLYPNPWETAEARYHPGQVTEAVVTSVVHFGAFARLEEGLDGLIHVSEMDCDGSHPEPGDLLVEGQHVVVRVLHVDGARQRLGLSLKVDELN
jgi:small subunit ribosomal protein S1